ncbi:MAG: hypothetical protein AUJ96_21240 [Armatimonadetes bacterium CG2_30_66_41]|nr:prolyl oligopeptidase family serine peptidase [Armatimonadota bacterium]OIO98432.1 MAG: hypothetical protein AUJ96_21240 [Armatimonadetes bacterium CG2_30_66_41]NCO91341.1 prolyl oligopeptidase family serine peptidase [Armatimonadota bacterium]NCP30507.1 prolyl oligopeptidase family serine peptidase [Armatimonadota bacterium]NCQ29280.1 prolyl oligopeptidase family serine peptidase [Armatimonadota bacterium]
MVSAHALLACTRLTSRLIFLAAPSGAAELPRAAQQAAVRADYERAERFGSPAMDRLVYKAKVNANWIEGAPRFWYRNLVRGESEFILVDAKQGARQPAFDHARLAAALSAATGVVYQPGKLPFQSIQFAGDGRAISFDAGDAHYRCDLTTYRCTEAERSAEPEAVPSETKPVQAAPARDPNESPDGKWIAFVKNHNVFLRAKEGGGEVQLTMDGEEKNADGNLRGWSPDSTKLVAYRTQPGDHLEMHMIESRPKEGVRPLLRSHEYALPGDKLDVHELWVFEAVTRKGIKVQIEPIDWWGPPDVRWKKDSRHFTYEQTHRGFQRVRVIEVDAATGKARTVIDERSNTFLPPMRRYSCYLGDGEELLWMSERDGWNHLYLIDGETGEVKNQVTRGPWAVHEVERVDEGKRQVWFTAGGWVPGRNPYLLQHFRANFDGSGLVRLTPGNGHHSATYSPDGEYLIDTYSRVDLAPVTELRRAMDGSLACELEQADVQDLLAAQWKWPESFVAKGRDGQTDIWGVIFRPSNLDATKKYPVVETIYAGPQGSSVPTDFAVRRGQQTLAELGFVVVQLDGMGMSGRSKAFHNVAYKNLGDSGFPDRILWMKAAAQRYPYLDLNRVGITGVSAGGYNAAHALIAHSESYKAAIAISGNHDHRTDKAWWNELWMGYPVGKHYEEQSNVVNASKLQGKLFLIHGELDDNVNCSASTMQFVDALLSANKDFDLLIVPGAGHGPGGPYVERRQWDFWVHNLRGEEPPEGYALKTPGEGSCNLVIRNLRREPVAIYWVNFEGKLQKYHDLQPDEEKQQHTFYGHQWEAQVAGKTVSTFAAEVARLEWRIVP